MIGLKKCPFCGQNDEDSNVWTDVKEVENGRWAISHFCRDVNEDIRHISIYADTEEQVRELWNKRAGE